MFLPHTITMIMMMMKVQRACREEEGFVVSVVAMVSRVVYFPPTHRVVHIQLFTCLSYLHKVV